MRISKVTLLLALFALVGAYSIQEVTSHPNGELGVSQTGCGGNGCHGTKSTQTRVDIWPDSSTIVAGQTYVFNIAVGNPTEAAGGCTISADKGTLATNGSGSSALKLYSKQLVQPVPKSFTGDSCTWKFKYTAPTTPGTYHIYAAGNAVNNNGTNDAGDHWNTTTYTVTVVSSSPQPKISVPTILRDTTLTGTSVTSSLWVKNAGTAALTINRFALKNGSMFSIADSSTHSIAAGDSAAVKITFSPTASGMWKDTVQFYSNDLSTPVALSVLNGLATAGLFHVSSTTVNFGSVDLGVSDTMSVTLKNTGNGALVVTPYPGNLNPDFKMIGLNPPAMPPLTLNPNETETAIFQFTPSARGGDTARFQLSISDYTGESHDTIITLVGEGLSNSSVAANPGAGQFFEIVANPSSGALHARTDLTGVLDVQVLDIGGRAVLNSSVVAQPDFILDISQLSSASYILRITPHVGEAFVRRIVIQH